MLHPLLSLWRNTSRATFYDRGMDARSAGSVDPWSDMLPPLGVRRGFRHTDEAADYLRFWMGDPSAQAELRWLLKRASPAAIASAGPERWVHALAGLLVTGSVAVVEEAARRAMPGRLGLAPGAATASAAALAAMPALAAAPVVPRVEDLLPALEDIRVEGAVVLPELDQSLAQVTATMGELDTAAASVAPAPEKVPEIGTVMTGVADQIQQSIDAA
jgi:hypothetical protein